MVSTDASADARERYQSLIENAPVPIVLAEEDGVLVELNDAAEGLFGRSSEELVGQPQTVLHPDGAEERYRTLFERHAEVGGAFRHLPDGDQIYVTDGDGGHIPVVISVSTVEHADGTLVESVFVDISEQVWYEVALEELHRNAESLLRAETTAEIAQSIVDTATDVLDLQYVSVNAFDPDAEVFRPVAHTEYPPGSDLPIPVPLDDSVTGDAFLSGESIRVPDVRETDDAYDVDTATRSLLVVPIAEFGVIICGDPSPGAFDEASRRILELLARHAETVVDRAEREQELKRREAELTDQARTLRQVEELNRHIRQLTQIARTAETRAELEREACEHFSSSDPFEFAWFGELAPERDELLPKSWAGADQGYLDTHEFELEVDCDDPAVRAAETGRTVVVPNTVPDVQGSPWRQEAVRRGFRSVISVPVAYEGILYGVLTVFAGERDAITSQIREVLGDWGELMGYAANEIERTNALLSQGGTALRLAVESRACPLLRIAQETECTFLFEGVSHRAGHDTTVFVTVVDDVPDDCMDTAATSTGISAVERLRETEDGALYRIVFSEPFIATVLAKYGLRLQSIVGRRDEAAQVKVVAPSTIPVHRAVEIVATEYPDSDLLSTEELTKQPRSATQFADRALAELTDRQREAIELAYHGGYFEMPKGLTGGDIADQMGISSSSFHNHLRSAERKILDAVMDAQSRRSR